MTTNQLKYFITAAEVLNFTEAGKIHYISQTAITQHIQSLEEQLGVKLFIRNRRHVELTPSGQIFLADAKAILERMRVSVEKAQKAADGITGYLNIGYVKGYENTIFGTNIKDFHNSYPNIDINLYRNSQLDLFLYLDQKKIDLAFNICYSNTDIDGFEKKYLDSIPLYAVLYPGHPYAQLSSIHRYDLRKESFFLTKYYEARMAQEYYIPEMFANSGFSPKIVGTSSDLETILLLVAAGKGISIMPESAIKFVKQSNDLVFIPLVGENEKVDVMAFWKKENENPAIESFLNSISSNER